MPDIKHSLDSNFYSISGRYVLTDNSIHFNWPSSGFNFSFTGSAAAIELSGLEFSELYYDVYIDHIFSHVLKQIPSQTKYLLCSDLPVAEHRVSIRRRNEVFAGTSIIKAIYLPQKGTLIPPPRPESRHILFVGDSLTCGYGVEVNKPEIPFELSSENSNKSYAAVAASELHADYTTIAESGRGLIRNYDNTTNRTLPKLYPYSVPSHTESGESEIWDHENSSFDVISINLGTNDFAVEPPLKENFINAYVDFVKQLAQDHKKSMPKIILLCGPALTNYWPEHSETKKTFRSLDICKEYLNSAKQLLKENYDIEVSVFELSQIDQKTGYGADYHPNEKQHKKNGKELAGYIKRIMSW